MRAIIAALLVLAATGVALSEPVPHEMTAKELLLACTASHKSNDYPVCLVFMGGYDAGAKATLAKVPWCRPPNLTVEEEILALVRIFRTHPQLLQESISTAVGAALVTAYPCHEDR